MSSGILSWTHCDSLPHSLFCYKIASRRFLTAEGEARTTGARPHDRCVMETPTAHTEVVKLHALGHALSCGKGDDGRTTMDTTRPIVQLPAATPVDNVPRRPRCWKAGQRIPAFIVRSYASGYVQRAKLACCAAARSVCWL